MKAIDDITGAVVECAYNVHVELGPGLVENVYEMVLGRALSKRGLFVERQKYVSFEYDEMSFRDSFRVDLLVNEQVVVELKSLESLAPIHSMQLLTYLRLMKLEVGLLLNFGAPTIKEGIRRIVNGYTPPLDSPFHPNNRKPT